MLRRTTLILDRLFHFFQRLFVTIRKGRVCMFIFEKELRIRSISWYHDPEKENKKEGVATNLWQLHDAVEKALWRLPLPRSVVRGNEKEGKDRDSTEPLFIPIFLPQRPGNTAVLNKDSVGESWPAYFLGRRDCFFELSQQRRLSSTGVGPFIVFLLLEETCRESARVVQLLLLYLETELLDASGIYAPTTRCCRCCSIHWSCYQRCCCGLGAVGTSWVRRSSWISRGTY